MAVSKLVEIRKDSSTPNAAFANYFSKFKFEFTIPGNGPKEEWFKFDFGEKANLSCIRNFNLYIATRGIDADIPVTLYRSSGVPKSVLNTDFAVEIPGSANVLSAVAAASDVTAVDWTITNFMSDTLWIKLDVPALTRGAGPITVGYFIAKDKA